MKKIILGMSAVIAASAMLTGCFSSKKAAEPMAKVTTQNVVIQRIDWQGASTGSNPPAWVEAVTSGDVDTVASALNIDSKKYKVFVISNSGPNLDFLKAWTDNVNVVSEVSGSLSRVVGQAVQANMQGTTEEVQKSVNQAVTVASSVELNGLEKAASYWIQTRRQRTGVETPMSDDDYEPAVYTYYVVYKMESAVFDKSLKSATDRGIPENTENASVLKQIITTSLAKTLIPEGL